MPRAAFDALRIAALALVLALGAAPLHAADVSAWLPWTWGTAPQGSLADAVTALRALPDLATVPALAVHVAPEGHWQFANAAGETFTAGTPAEIARAPATLAPDAKDGFASLRLILSQDSLVAGAAALKDLPATRSLFAVIGRDLVPLTPTAQRTLNVNLRPHVGLSTASPDTFLEALAQLRRPLDPSRLRVLSLVPGGPASLPSSPRFDAALGGAAVDVIDPAHLTGALASIPRQTAIITARIDATNLSAQPPSGPEITLSWPALTTAAQDADVDLIVLEAGTPRQPGGRNWLWQRVKVWGLDAGAKRGTLADLIESLARAPFIISAAFDGEARVRLTATPDAVSLATGDGITDWLKQAAGAVTREVTGEIAAAAIHAHLVSHARHSELSARLIPGVPSSAQGLYLLAAALGLLGWPIAWGWWRRIWPTEARAEYASARGFVLARAIRTLAFALVFLPLAAIPALAARLVQLTRRKPRAAVS